MKYYIFFERSTSLITVLSYGGDFNACTTQPVTRGDLDTKTSHRERMKIANRGVMISCSLFFTYYSSSSNNVCISAMFDLGTEREHLTEEWSEYYIRARNNGVARAEPTNTKFPRAV